MRQHRETAMDVQERAETEAGIDISTPTTGVDAVPEPIELESKPRSHLHQQAKPTKPYGDPYEAKREEPRPQNRMVQPQANRRPGRPRKIS